MHGVELERYIQLRESRARAVGANDAMEKIRIILDSISENPEYKFPIPSEVIVGGDLTKFSPEIITLTRKQIQAIRFLLVGGKKP